MEIIEFLSDNLTLVVAGIFICIICFFQWVSFLSTKKIIQQLDNFFPGIDSLQVKKYHVKASVMQYEKALKKFMASPKSIDADENYQDDVIEVPLIINSNESNPLFNQIILKTNAYLCKNAGTTSELSILTDICEHQLDSLEEKVHNSLNVPLFLGLAGTFTGIILGLIGVDFKEIFATDAVSNMTGLQHLLTGVIFAMFASLLGLLLTVFNSAFSFKSAVSNSSEKKDDYFDFLRRELVPTLSSSMSQSLNSLKGVLGHFVDKFGRNLDAYADSAAMLNDNLEKQHLVLAQINEFKLTETAATIAKTFKTLKESAESLENFKTYQNQLNATIKGMNGAVTNMDSLILKFDEFKTGLTAVVSNQDRYSQIEQEFKDAIETHFPTGAEARDAWRKEFDTLIVDAKTVTGQLSEQLTASTSYIKNFVERNNEFFSSFEQIKEVMDAMVQYTQVQANCYKDLKQEIINLRTDYKDAQVDMIELNKALQNAIKQMTQTFIDSTKTKE